MLTAKQQRGALQRSALYKPGPMAQEKGEKCSLRMLSTYWYTTSGWW